MVINSAQMQNAGKEFMLFQAVSMRQDTLVSKDSFSAIFNKVTGSDSLFKTEKSGMNAVETNNNNVKDKFLKDGKYTKNESISLETNVTKETKFVEKTEETIKAEDTSDNDEATEDVSPVDEVSDDFIEKAASLFVQITYTIQIVMNVSAEEFSQGMQGLGMQPGDLLQADNRYSLFVNLKASGDATNLLKDNSLVELLNTMENQISELFANAGIESADFGETLKDCLNSVLEKTNEIMQTFVTQAPLKEISVQPEELNSETVVVDGIVNEKTPKIEAYSQSQNNSTENNNTESSSKKEKEQPVKADDLSNKFVNHLVNSFENRYQQVNVSEIQYMPNIREIVNQIMEQVKIHVNNANTSIEIQLTPEALGKVHVSVEDNNGVVTAKFQAESRVAKEAIESNLVNFKEHLAEQGIKVDSIEVSVGNFNLNGHQFGKGQQQDNESHVKKHFSLEDAGSISESSGDLKEAAYIDNGTSTVSFTA